MTLCIVSKEYWSRGNNTVIVSIALHYWSWVRTAPPPVFTLLRFYLTVHVTPRLHSLVLAFSELFFRVLVSIVDYSLFLRFFSSVTCEMAWPVYKRDDPRCADFRVTLSLLFHFVYGARSPTNNFVFLRFCSWQGTVCSHGFGESSCGGHAWTTAFPPRFFLSVTAFLVGNAVPMDLLFESGI